MKKLEKFNDLLENVATVKDDVMKKLHKFLGGVKTKAVGLALVTSTAAVLSACGDDISSANNQEENVYSSSSIEEVFGSSSSYSKSKDNDNSTGKDVPPVVVLPGGQDTPIKQPGQDQDNPLEFDKKEEKEQGETNI